MTFGDSTLWFAARSASKTGLANSTGGGVECWTLVSTAAYAVAEIERVPMQDPVSGAFRPQVSLSALVCVLILCLTHRGISRVQTWCAVLIKGVWSWYSNLPCSTV